MKPKLLGCLLFLLATQAWAHRLDEYLQAVVGLDEKVLAMTLTDTSFPTLEGVQKGMGVIRIKATAPIKPLSLGHHTLNLTNAHLPAISVYLVNALTPKDRAIKIRKQTRDELQTTYRLEFSVGSSVR